MKKIAGRALSILLVCAVFITFIPVLGGSWSYAASSSKLGKVKKITVAATENKAKITWGKVKGAKKYQIVVKTGSKKIKSVKNKKRVLKLKKLKKNKKYTVRIRAIRGKKKGKWSKKSFITKKAASNNKASASKPVSSPKPTETEQENPVEPDNSVSVGDIEDMLVNGKVDAGYNDHGGFDFVYGQFTDQKVTDEETAVDVLCDSSSIVGYNFDAYNCLVEEEETDLNSSIYRFYPYVNDIPVIGGEVLLEAADNGTVEGLYNTYDPRVQEIDLFDEDGTEIDAEEAEIIAISDFLKKEEGILQLLNISEDLDEYDLIEALKEELYIDSQKVIYSEGNEEGPFLAYEVSIQSADPYIDEFDDDDNFVSEEDEAIPTYSDDEFSEDQEVGDDFDGSNYYFNYTYYIYACGENSGEIYFADDGIRGAGSWTNTSRSAVDGKGNSRTINAQKNGERYRLIDKKRNIVTYRAGGAARDKLPGNIVEGDSIPRTAVSAHANMSAVYDFYKKIGRNSFDNNGSQIIVTYNYRDPDYPNGYYNAVWNGIQMAFGDLGNFQNALDVAGHEFSHAVIDRSPAQFKYDGESGALNEAYADILGTLIEGKTGSGRWLIGEDSDTAIRSMANPESFEQPSHYANYYKTNEDYHGVHTNSGIFNHAAYLMMNDSDTANVDRYRWGKLFVGSLSRLSSKSKFLNARYAIETTAKKMGFSNKELDAIRRAFESTGIIVRDRIRISLSWGKNPEDIDLHIVGPAMSATEESSRFHVYYEDLQYKDKKGNLIADLDHDDTDSYGPEVATIRKMTFGTYYVFVHDYTNRESNSPIELSRSDARIKIYSGDSTMPFATYKVPPLMRGKYWNVCKIVIGEDGKASVTPINTVSENQNYS